MPGPNWQWVANPDLISAAIKLLVGAVVLSASIISTIGAALIGVIVYIWRKTDSKVDRIATSLEELTLNTSVRIASIEATCKGNHANHQRSGDSTP